MSSTSRWPRQFQQFTRWVFWLCLTFGGIMLAAGLRLQDARLEPDGRDHARARRVTCTLIARAPRDGAARAGLIMSVATLLSILALTFIAPTFGPALVVATLVPAAIALQHGRGERSQLWFVVLCWLSAMCIAIVAEMHIPASAEGTWLDRGFRLAGIACANGIMLLLLWHAARRAWDRADTADQAQQETMIADARRHESETRLQEAIDERARLVTQLRDAPATAVIGRLVGGVAQDFNNHLTSLVGYTELLLFELTEENGQRQDLLKSAAPRSGQRS